MKRIILLSVTIILLSIYLLLVFDFIKLDSIQVKILYFISFLILAYMPFYKKPEKF